MYSNIGNKLKIVAKVIGVIGIVACVGAFLLEVSSGFDDYEGMLVAIACPSGLLLFVGSWIVYAFGQLTDDVHKISSNSKEN